MKRYSDCREVREEFSAYLDAEMTAEEREGVEAHLAGCAECLRELDTHKRVDVAYRRLEPVGAPLGFERGVRDAVRTGRMPTESGRRPVPRWMGPLVAMGSAAAVLIVGMLVMESRQGEQSAQPEMMAKAPEALEQTNAMKAAAPMPVSADAASSERAAEEVREQASGGAAWDNFTRDPDARAPEQQAAGAWEKFKQDAPEPAPSVSAGREDRSDALADGLKDATAPAATGVAEADASNAEMKRRAELIGTPPASNAAESAGGLEKVLDEQKEEAVASAPAAPAPAPSPLFQRPAQAGDVVSRQTLRSFSVRADGAWVESTYADQPCTALARGSAVMRETMKSHPSEDWSSMLKRPARQIFEIDGTWYDLEAEPEKDE